MPQLQMSHFEYCVLFALLCSVVFGVVSRDTNHERVRYAVRCFAYFIFTVIALGWLMYLGHR